MTVKDDEEFKHQNLNGPTINVSSSEMKDLYLQIVFAARLDQVNTRIFNQLQNFDGALVSRELLNEYMRLTSEMDRLYEKQNKKGGSA